MPLNGSKLRLWKKTHAGRVVYKRKKHLFKPKDYPRLAIRYVNEHPTTDVEDVPDAEFWPWNSLAFVAEQRKVEIRRRWWSPAENAPLMEIVDSRQAGMALELWQFCQAVKKVVAGIATYGSWIPYVGQVCLAGKAALEFVWEKCGMNLPYGVAEEIDPDTGLVRWKIYWP